MKAGAQFTPKEMFYFFFLFLIYFCLWIWITQKVLELSTFAKVRFYPQIFSFLFSIVFEYFKTPYVSLLLMFIIGIIFVVLVTYEKKNFYLVFLAIFNVFLFIIFLYIQQLYLHALLCKASAGDIVVVQDFLVNFIQINYKPEELIHILVSKILLLNNQNDEYFIWEYSSAKFVCVKKADLFGVVSLKCRSISDLLSFHAYMLKALNIFDDNNLRPTDIYVKLFSDVVRVNHNNELKQVWYFIGDFFIRVVYVPVFQYFLTLFDQEQFDTFWRYISPRYQFDITNVRRGPHVPQDSYFDRLTSLRQNYSAATFNPYEITNRGHFNNILLVWYGLFFIAKQLCISIDKLCDWLTYQSLFYPGLGFQLKFSTDSLGLEMSYYFNIFLGSKKLLMWIDYLIPGISKYFLFIPFPNWIRFLPTYSQFEPSILLYPYSTYFAELSNYPLILTEHNCSREMTLLEYYKTCQFNKFIYYTLRSFQLDEGLQYNDKFYSYYIYVANKD